MAEYLSRTGSFDDKSGLAALVNNIPNCENAPKEVHVVINILKTMVDEKKQWDASLPPATRMAIVAVAGQASLPPPQESMYRRGLFPH